MGQSNSFCSHAEAANQIAPSKSRARKTKINLENGLETQNTDNTNGNVVIKEKEEKQKEKQKPINIVKVPFGTVEFYPDGTQVLVPSTYSLIKQQFVKNKYTNQELLEIYLKAILIVQKFTRICIGRIRRRKLKNKIKLIQSYWRFYQAHSSYLRDKKSAIILQSLIRKVITRKFYKTIVRRKMIANEILTTEKNFITNMQRLIDAFVIPLSQDNSILNPEEIKILFSEVRMILEVNKILYEKLQICIANWKVDSTVGLDFIDKAPLLKCYSVYINNYDNAMSLLAKLDLKKSFQSFLESKSLSTQELQSLLIQPIQRLPRYVLLLTEMKKYVPKHFFGQLNTDSKALLEIDTTALEKIREITLSINEKKRLNEQQNELLILATKIEQSITYLIEPHRRIVGSHSGTAKFEDGSSFRCKIYLLSDQLLFLKKRFKGKNTLEAVADLTTLRAIKISENKKEYILIGKKTLTVQPNSKANTNDFYELILTTKKELSTKENSKKLGFESRVF
eukprot:TRINITY_DN2829_c2_g5_i1.p1 TRINITY_DN2829_c2_g5~~TRINITY_DN2829_c2_g5_i1.p1  ORF type:complete len:509 (-),score=187.66 TRINITY_DN2829_c2_g5_i1:2-1528(-)